MNSKHLRVDALKGIDESYRTDPTAASLIQDMTWDSGGGWKQVGGYAPILPEAQGNPAFAGVGKVKSLHWWSNKGGKQQYLMSEYIGASASNLSLWYFNGSTKAMVAIDSNRTNITSPWQRTQYLAVGDWLYYINGEDPPARWNGKRVSRVGFDRVPAPPRCEATSHKDQIISGTYPTGTSTRTNYNFASARGVGNYLATNEDQGYTYGYAVTYLNDLGMESEPSPIVYVQGENKAVGSPTKYSERTYIKVELPDAPPNVRGTRLWRTTNLFYAQSGYAANLYLLKEWGCGKGTTYADGIPDGELGLLLDTSNLGSFPTKSKYISYFKGTMFVAYGDTVYYSAAGLHEQFPASNYFRLGNNDNGEVTGFYAHKNALVVFKRRGVFLIKGDPSKGFFSQTLTEELGCSAPNALTEVPDGGMDKWGRSSGSGLLFLSDSGIFMLEGALENTGRPTSFKNIGQPIQKFFKKRVNTSALLNAYSVLNHKDREVWMQVPVDGELGATTGLVYHYDIDSWSIRKDWPISAFTTCTDHRGYIFMGSNDASHAGIHVYTDGYGDKDGVSLNSLYRSTWIDFGTVWQRAQVQHTRPYIMGYGSNTISFKYGQDQEDLTIPTDTSKAQQSSEKPQEDQWGTALWGSGTWGDYELTPLTWTAGINAREYQWELSTANRALIVSVDLVVRPVGSPTNIEFLDATIAPEGT